MKLLADSCLPRSVVAALRAEGHDVVAIAERGADPGDRRILEQAATENRVIVTIDSDFGGLVFREAIARVGVLRLLQQRPEVMSLRAVVLVERYAGPLNNGAFVVDDGASERVRPKQ